MIPELRIRDIPPRIRLVIAGAITTRCVVKLCRISAALRQSSNVDSHFVGFLVVRNEHHRRDASLFSIAVQFPKLDVAGSIPVSRSWFQELSGVPFPPFPLISKSKGHHIRTTIASWPLRCRAAPYPGCFPVAINKVRRGRDSLRSAEVGRERRDSK